jgi:head-tail adaptor
MRTLVTIEQKTTERSDVEATPEQWGEFAKAYCEVLITAAGETLESGQPAAETTYVLTTHWTPTLGTMTAAMRVSVPGGPPLGIRSVVNTNLENKELVITCVERS